MRKKKKKVSDLSVATALYTADSYFVAAVRAALDSKEPQPKDPPQQFDGPSCVAISSHAFAIEVYIKTLIYLVDGRVVENHDLMFLWHKLPSAIREWISSAFEENLDEQSKYWTVSAFVNPNLSGSTGPVKVATGENSAEGIIKSHRLAFLVGRYAYELPSASEMKLIAHNVPALERVSALLRALAYHVKNRVESEQAVFRKEGAGPGEKRVINIDFPSGRLEPYPDEAVRIINERVV